MRGTLRWKDGAWRLQFKIEGRWVHRTVRAPNTKAGRAAAERERARMVLDLSAGRHAGGGEWTVAQWWDHCLRLRRAHLAGWSQSTERSYTFYVHRDLSDVWLYTLTPAGVRDFYLGLLTKPGMRKARLSPASVHRIHDSFRAVLEMAVQEGLLDRNPAERAKLPTLPDPEVRPAKLEEIHALIEAAPDDPMMLSFIAIGSNTGQRRGSLCALQWSDLDEGVLTFRRGWTRGPDGWDLRATKTGRNVRSHLGPLTLGVLDAWREATESMHGDCYVDPVWIFTREPGVPMLPTTMTSRWKKLRESAGVPHVTMKSLRPYFATSLLAQGEELKVVQKLGGWATPQVLLRHYAEYQDPVGAAAAVRHEGAIFNGPNDPSSVGTNVPIS
jgi:integrase